MGKLQHVQAQAAKKYLWLLAFIPVITALFFANEQQQWLADYRSPVGERKTIVLPDGGKIILNSRSAIDVQYSAQQRRIILRKGEIWIETQPDPLKRPFMVYTPQGVAQALGTKYWVKKEPKDVYVGVVQGAVKITTQQSQQQQLIGLNQQSRFNQNHVQQPVPLDQKHITWVSGFITVDAVALKDFMNQLKPYQNCVLRIDPKVAQIKISGSYPIDDLDKTYKMIAKTYGLEIDEYMGGYFKYIQKK
ncbi:FecR family protein [Acinetobacter larvae]|uniref:FecR protein domain-containing protein n=1 Tax=Acinetobacter larvae TaxID=1789224 RepID=A0A1B2LZJ3_9GAMM|nr:FecR domain-containing protein [Acinetobacter larvae]AOA58370.1 hypothetical protein BFG52_08395 [Acinetobacter larvae]